MAVVVALVLLIAASASAGKRECEDEPALGICNNVFHRYFFNTTSGRCQSYYYGGCGVSWNNFQTYKECHDTCAHGTPYSAAVADCTSKPEVGFCDALFRNYYFDEESGSCKQFVYGGCGGNGNNYKTLGECQTTCGVAVDKQVLCTQKAETGLCRAYIPSFYYNAGSGECESFIYGGCGGNDNRFDSKDSCHATCAGVTVQKRSVDTELLCAQKAETGPCRAYIPSYYYNTESGECESFIYGGCGGNDNRFHSKENCHATCGAAHNKRSVEAPEVLCAQKAETGLCMAYFPSYFYNIESGHCEFFVYGGCGGNSNRFANIEDCHATCAGVSKAPEEVHDIKNCFLPAETGPCRSNVPRYYFNRAHGQCEPFLYGGCGGNKNNWASEQDCSNHCLM